MVNEFNKIIGDVLATEGAVHLPDIGTLAVVRRPAERISSRRLRRSCNAVLFTEKVRGRSIVDAVAEACGTDADAAWDIYERWVLKSMDDGVLAIDGVGHIDRHRFYIADEFDKVLNPNGHQVVELVNYRKSRVWIWLAVVTALLLAVGCGVYFILTDRQGDADRTEAVPQHEVAVTSGETAAADIAGPESTEAAEPVTEPDAAAATEQTPAETVTNPDATETAVEAEAPAQTAGPDTSVKSVPQPTDGVGRLTSGWSYVVYGVFSSEDNAMRAVSELRSKGVTGCSAFAYGAKYMVSPYFSADAAECAAFIRGAKEYENLWVYTAR